ncbi:hypothetical protein ACI8AA_16530 [Geodermatophilus sp. SYSU D01180]
MSREEAHRRTPARRRRTPSGPPRPTRAPEDEARPLPPLSTARTDRTAGVIRVRGRLDLIGAEALCRTVTGLLRLGHRQVVVRLDSATVADDARALLADLARRMPAGERLVLR